jgi:hypothetical protein
MILSSSALWYLLCTDSSGERNNKGKEGGMKKHLSLAVIVCGLMLAAAPAMAVDCSTITTLDELISSGCTIQDKVFSNFSYSATNPLDAAANIKASAVFNAGPTTDQHGWTFTNANGLWSAGSFTLSYTISVAPGYPTVTIFQSIDQILDGAIGTALPSITDTQSVGTLTVNNLTAGNLTASLAYPGVTSVTTSSVATVGENGLQSYEQDWFEQTRAVPEPSMLLLLGFGLVSVAGFRKKFKK